MPSIDLIELHPVVFTGSSGGGPNEYSVACSPQSATTISIPVPLKAGQSMQLAWYAPHDEIADYAKFSSIDVQINEAARAIDLTVLAEHGQLARKQLKIQVLATGTLARCSNRSAARRLSF